MKHCDRCDIDVESNLKNCPLCGAYLKSDGSDKVKSKHAYREVLNTNRSRRIVLKLMLFASILASIICLIIDVTVNDKLLWSMHLITAIIGTWLVLLRPCFMRISVRRQLIWDMFVAIAVVFYAEYFAKTTTNWGFHLALPIVLIATLGIFALMMVIDHKHWQSYAMTITPIAFLTIIPLFISLGVFHRINWSWYVATGLSVIMLVSFFIFGKQGYVAELKKRLHF